MDPAAQGSSLTEGKRSKRSKKGAENGNSGGGEPANNASVNNVSATDATDISAVANASDVDIKLPKVVTEDVSKFKNLLQEIML